MQVRHLGSIYKIWMGWRMVDHIARYQQILNELQYLTQVPQWWRNHESVQRHTYLVHERQACLEELFQGLGVSCSVNLCLEYMEDYWLVFRRYHPADKSYIQAIRRLHKRNQGVPVVFPARFLKCYPTPGTSSFAWSIVTLEQMYTLFDKESHWPFWYPFCIESIVTLINAWGTNSWGERFPEDYSAYFNYYNKWRAWKSGDDIEKIAEIVYSDKPSRAIIQEKYESLPDAFVRHKAKL